MQGHAQPVAHLCVSLAVLRALLDEIGVEPDAVAGKQRDDAGTAESEQTLLLTLDNVTPGDKRLPDTAHAHRADLDHHHRTEPG